MKHIEIINGPNLNLTGLRQPDIYGSTTMEQMLADLRKQFPNIQIGYFQSNIEGQLIDRIHQVGFSADGIIINAGGYSHTSVALHDAIASVPAPAIEVHLSNIFAREDYRHHSLLTSACRGIICGLGIHGYSLAIQNLIS
ncbi:MAG: type II 3-dehydroquinate dehydratase [Bacteroidales bacterium]|nr:type II 3-dehydroquinate dehydratase [Bacteroidales bacterium]